MSGFGDMTVNDTLSLFLYSCRSMQQDSTTTLWKGERVILARLGEMEVNFSFYVLKHTYSFFKSYAKTQNNNAKWQSQIYLKHKQTHTPASMHGFVLCVTIKTWIWQILSNLFTLFPILASLGNFPNIHCYIF